MTRSLRIRFIQSLCFGLFCIAALYAPLQAACGAALSPVEAEAVLQKLRIEAATIHSLSGRFTQETTLARFSQTVRFKGLFAYRQPDALRWEYTAPVVSGFTVAGSKGSAWSKAAGADSRSPFGKTPALATLAEHILPWLVFDETALRREYALDVLAVSPPTLRMTPKNAALRQFVDFLTVAFSPAGAVAEEVCIQESQGNTIILRFSPPVVNAPIADEVFAR